MNDSTDLSKLSSTEIIDKIAELAVAYDGVWIIESIAKLHVLTVVLKQAVIREASIGQVFFTTDERPVAIGAKELKVGGRTFDLILKETT